MAVQDQSINPEIIKSATAEFLQKGFKNSSLRVICANAGVTTGALYKRYKGKEELFDAIVSPTLKDWARLGEQMMKNAQEYLDKDELNTMWDVSEENHRYWIEFIYERYEGFKLLLCCSEGSKHSNFLHDFVEGSMAPIQDFVHKAADNSGEKVDSEVFHILLTAYWTAVFEPVVHGFSKEKALSYSTTLTRFFNWKAFFNL